jgi:hypothetical protein
MPYLQFFQSRTKKIKNQRKLRNQQRKKLKLKKLQEKAKKMLNFGRLGANNILIQQCKNI